MSHIPPHPDCLGRVSDGVLIQAHDFCHTQALVLRDQWLAGDFTGQWSPDAILLYHDRVAEEMLLRNIPHLSNLNTNAWFNRCVAKSREKDLLCLAMPFTRVDFVHSVVAIYMTDPKPGRLDRHPEAFIDAFDWIDMPAEREAALRILYAKWSEALKRA